LLNLQASPLDTLIESPQQGFFGPDDHIESLIISNRSWIELRSSTPQSSANADRALGGSSLITAFIITENNSNQAKKMYRKQFGFKKNECYEMFEFRRIAEADEVEEARCGFLNKRMLKVPDVGHFEIVSFGFK
jgi:hypothetical protein